MPTCRQIHHKVKPPIERRIDTCGRALVLGDSLAHDAVIDQSLDPVTLPADGIGHEIVAELTDNSRSSFKQWTAGRRSDRWFLLE